MLYSQEFFAINRSGSLQSAKQMVPPILELIKPRSVIDVGCGIGTWASVFLDYGLTDVLGIDGSWVKQESMMIPAENFRANDLTDPSPLDKRFDLAISLEVAEHLPRNSADEFVNFLSTLSDVVIFSAAVPQQGGIDHINEQWPTYWAEKFLSRGYQPYDVIRPIFWNNNDVEWWYAQNSIVYVRSGVRNELQQQLARMPCFATVNGMPAALVHSRAIENRSQRVWSRTRIKTKAVEIFSSFARHSRGLL